MERNGRINLLSESQIHDLYTRPLFDKREREFYFHADVRIRNVMKAYKTTKTRSYFLMQLGYFRAKHLFYDFTFEDAFADMDFVTKTYFEGEVFTKKIARVLISKQRSEILQLMGYRLLKNGSIPEVESHLDQLMRYFPKGTDTLKQLLVHFENKRLVIPTYRALQDIFTRCFSRESARLSTLIQTLPPAIQGQLEGLIVNNEGVSQLSIARTDQKDFRYLAIKMEVEKAVSLESIYHFAQGFIPILLISKNAVRYYASLVEQYPISRLRKIKKEQQFLYLICFAYHRYQQLMDNLLCSFTVHIRRLLEKSNQYAKEQEAKHNNAVVAQFPKLAKFLKWFSSDKQNPEMRYLDFSKQAFAILPKSQFSVMANFMEGNTFDKEAARWDYLSSTARMLSLYLRPILCAVHFEYYKTEGLILTLMKFLKKHYSQNKTPAELKTLLQSTDLKLSSKILPYLVEQDGGIDPHRFEFYVYKKIYHEWERGRLFCNESISYGSLENDLCSPEVVDQADEIVHKLGYPKILDYCDNRLDEALKMLDAAWELSNHNIASGKNPGIKIEVTEKSKTWNLLYDADKKSTCRSFFSTLEPLEIADVVRHVAEQVDLWKAFTHIKFRYKKYEQSEPLAIMACILSEALGFGTQKMAEMSDMSFNLLRSTHENFIRVETLKAANDQVINFVDSLSIFKIWNLMGDFILGDGDGKKYKTIRQTIQSRYSQKYFGLDKGIVVDTFSANNLALNSKVIGPNEHESHHLYDLVYNNNSEFDVSYVTGDNHSINQLNFVCLDSINTAFVPSIKNIRSEAEKLFAFTYDPKQSDLIKPAGTINKDLIKSEKEQIVRILLTLLTQENTQSIIIRKLSSHKRYSRLRLALWEYNKIFKSTHVLNLINDMQFRKAIRTARNRTESYHQMQGFFKKVYNAAFKGGRTLNNSISAEAARLLANITIAYNSLILNKIYEKLCMLYGEEKAKKIIAKISPIAWDHLFFTGKYLFKSKKHVIDLDAFVSILEQQLKKSL